METQNPTNTRVRHDHYGDGTVIDQSGLWLLVLFDEHMFAISVHADDTAPIEE
jgi:hypothetical protein